MTDSPTPQPRPHVRWGAIVWGLIVIATAGGILFVLADAGRTAAFASWLGGLTWGIAVVVGVLALGALALILGLLAVIRRAQRR